jgi:nitrite reductase/ring-hydroxylating ferredoxin subunit/uncharacterized membrane protein
MRPLPLDQLPDRIERLELLDGIGNRVQELVRAVVPSGSAVKETLSGTWLGHPLHPPLTDVVLGTWTSALLLDLIGREADERASDTLVATGVLAALPTAATGASDWADLRGGTSRIGTVHALGNSTALVLHALSLAARRRGSRRLGLSLSATGYAAVTGAAWLGGHLSFRKGVGVDQTAFESGPAEWTVVLDEDELSEDVLTPAQAGDLALLLVRVDGTIHALADRCSHRGCALHEGELRDETIVCPCHGSTFQLDGAIVRGPATAPQPVFETRLRDGSIEVRRPRTSEARELQHARSRAP